MLMKTWGSVYRAKLRAGYIDGYAAYLADRWEKNQMNYYVCDYQTHRVLLGPATEKWVVEWIYKQGVDQNLYCNMSRYGLAKEGIYPNTKAGNAQLAHDLKEVDEDIEGGYLPLNLDGLGLCPKCKGAYTLNGTLCRVCAEEELADRG
jgi:hypothetical protein